MSRHLLDIEDLSPGELMAVLEFAGDDYPPRVLSGRGVALVFRNLLPGRAVRPSWACSNWAATP